MLLSPSLRQYSPSSHKSFLVPLDYPDLIPFQTKEIKREYPHFAKGSFGIIYKGKTSQFGDETIVIKDIPNINNKTIEEWKQEIEVMNINKSPYIVEIFGYSYNKNMLTIVMEYMINGSLYDVLHQRKINLTILQRMRMVRHVALGIAELHKNNFVHRDIKSMNVVVGEDFSCKLCDFGSSVLESNVKNLKSSIKNCTPLWSAPEIRKGKESFPADVYSLGVVMYEIFERLPEYDNLKRQVVLPTSFKAQAIILPCLDENPSNRPTALEVSGSIVTMMVTFMEQVMEVLTDEEKEILSQIVLPFEYSDKLECDIQRLNLLILLKNDKSEEMSEGFDNENFMNISLKVLCY